MHQDSCRRAVVDDLDLEPISMYLQSASVHHFENTARHENPLIVAAGNYIPDPADRLESSRRRPKHVITDPPDPLTVLLALLAPVIVLVEPLVLPLHHSHPAEPHGYEDIHDGYEYIHG
uniref:Uncharacterized protein n=1 Tax=Bombyx mori TaxID=7091 RepID=A0A8R2R871_BOMMO|nr:uncharacterized protein LOC119630422 isoform X1 [Bombyx mori]